MAYGWSTNSASHKNVPYKIEPAIEAAVHLCAFKGVISAKMVKIIKFLFFAQKVSSGMGALRPKFLGG